MQSEGLVLPPEGAKGKIVEALKIEGPRRFPDQLLLQGLVVTCFAP